MVNEMNLYKKKSHEWGEKLPAALFFLSMY